MKHFVILTLFISMGCQSPKEMVVASEGAIGTRYFTWVDALRTDPYYGGNRLINVQVWYPSDESAPDKQEHTAPYYYKIDQVYQHLDNWTNEDYQTVSGIETASVTNAPLQKGVQSFGVVLFSPALGSNISQYTFYAEHLAKKGFVVVGINHLYESEYVIDLEQEVIPLNHTFHDSLKSLKIPEEISADRYREVKGIRQKILGEDLVFCLNELSSINDQEFAGKLKLDGVGVMGHSIGGAGAIYAGILDDRIAAVLDIDGTPPTQAFEDVLKVPFMFIEDLIDYKNHPGYQKVHRRRARFCNSIKADAYRVMIGGTNHNSFLDIHYHLAEQMEAKRSALNILNQTANYAHQFFDYGLKGLAMNLPAIQTDTLEIIIYPVE